MSNTNGPRPGQPVVVGANAPRVSVGPRPPYSAAPAIPVAPSAPNGSPVHSGVVSATNVNMNIHQTIVNGNTIQINLFINKMPNEYLKYMVQLSNLINDMSPETAKRCIDLNTKTMHMFILKNSLEKLRQFPTTNDDVIDEYIEKEIGYKRKQSDESTTDQTKKQKK